jgi:hypothetical protein
MILPGPLSSSGNIVSVDIDQWAGISLQSPLLELVLVLHEGRPSSCDWYVVLSCPRHKKKTKYRGLVLKLT